MDSGPILPVEIIDFIIEKAWEMKNDPDRTRILANLALLSRSCWVWVNRLRFETVALVETTNRPLVSHIHALRDLIEADPRSEITGLASHIRSLMVQISGLMIHPAYPIEGYESISDGSLAIILKKVFKATPDPLQPIGLEVPPVRQCSLTLELGFAVGLEPLERSYNWPSLPPDFISAFFQCLQNPSLTTLHISYVDQFPISILRDSFIRHFAVDNGTPSPSLDRSFDGIEIIGHNRVVFLESLSADLYMPIRKLVDFSPKKDLSLKAAFSRLKKFSTCIEQNSDSVAAMKFISEAPFLEVLTINYTSFCGPGPDSSLDLQQSLSLRQLTMAYCRVDISFKGQEDYALHYIHRTLNQHSLSPNLKDLKVLFIVEKEENLPVHWTQPKDIFANIDCSALDEHFSGPMFHSLSSLAFTFDFTMLHPKVDKQKFLRDSRGWFHEKKPFPLLARIGGLQFNVLLCPRTFDSQWQNSDEDYIL